jgi:hypothetical protein
MIFPGLHWPGPEDGKLDKAKKTKTSFLCKIGRHKWTYSDNGLERRCFKCGKSQVWRTWASLFVGYRDGELPPKPEPPAVQRQNPDS